VSTTRRLLQTLTPYRGLVLLALVATTLASAFDGATLVILIPFLRLLFGSAGGLETGNTRLEELIARGVSPLIEGRSTAAAGAILIGLLLGALLLKNAFAYLHAQTNFRIQENVVRDLRTRAFDRLLLADLRFFQHTRIGQMLAALVADADQVKVAVSAALVSLCQNALVVVTTLVILVLLSPRLTVLTLAAAPLLLFGVQLLLRRLRRHARQGVEERGRLTALATERIGAIKLIRASGTEEAESRQFAEHAGRYRKRVLRTQRYGALTTPVTELFAAVVLLLVLWAATEPALAGTALGPEATIAFVLAALKTMHPLKALTQFPVQWATALASAERVFALTDEPAVESRGGAGGGKDPAEAEATFHTDIVFDRVSFSYDGQVPVLTDISFRVTKGEVVALVGPSGAGKTTLLELLPRFWDPSGGEIRLDGVPLTRLSRRSIRRLLAVVGQDTVLLNDTVFANIAYGVPGASREAVHAAAVAANAVEFIARLPHGYDTMLGERGARLSGGQRQRIAIARALLRDAPILILDEATSALDSESERLVQQAIERLMADRTVLVIAHRLATVRHADQILVLERGRIVERGTHDSLLAAQGRYRRWYDLQFGPAAAVDPA
jgi:subfamily B ATP-binding cassette protein MsbA